MKKIKNKGLKYYQKRIVFWVKFSILDMCRLHAKKVVFSLNLVEKY